MTEELVCLLARSQATPTAHSPPSDEAPLSATMACLPRVQSLSKRLKTLVLNADYQPISLTSARRSLNLCQENKAHLVESLGRGVRVRAESIELDAPSVIVLAAYQRVKRSSSPQDGCKTDGKKDARRMARPARALVYERDGHTCQYCGARAQTLDHILPKSKGGLNTFDNVVACCQVALARRRASKSLGEASLIRPETPMRRNATTRRGTNCSARPP